MHPLRDGIFKCSQNAYVDWEQVAADYDLETRLSDVARNILAKSECEEDTLEDLEELARDIVGFSVIFLTFCQE